MDLYRSSEAEADDVRDLHHVADFTDTNYAHIARSLTPPESFDTLMTRTVAALYLFRDVTGRDVADSEAAVTTHLETYSRVACELWKEMERTAGRSARF